MKGKSYRLLCIFLLFALAATGQDNCYDNLRKEGLRLAQKEQFEPAINKYLAALNCPDKPVDDDLPKLIRKALQARVRQLEAARDTAAAMQTRAENFSSASLANKYIARSIVENTVNHNPSKALRFAELALEFDSTSGKAIEQYYNACYQPLYKYDEAYYRLAFPKRVIQSEYGFPFATFDPGDTSRLFSVGLDGHASWWNRNSKSETLLSEGNGPLQIGDMSSDGQLVALGGKNGHLKIMKSNGEVLASKQAHNNVIHGLKFFPDNQHIITSSWDGTIKIWSQTGLLLDSLHTGQPNYYAALSPDQQYLWIGTDDHLLRYNLQNDPTVQIMGQADTIAYGQYFNFDFSPDGQYMACTKGKWIEIRDKNGLLRESLIETQAGTPYWVTFSPDGRYLASAGVDGLTRLWELSIEEGLSQTILTLSHDGVINCVQFSPDGRYLLTASSDKTLRLWDLKMENVTVIQHDHPVNWIDLYEQKYIFTITTDSMMHIWDRQGNELLLFRPRSLNSAFVPHPSFSQTISFGDKLGIWLIEHNEVIDFSGQHYPVIQDATTGQLLLDAQQDTFPLVQSYFFPHQQDTLIFFDYLNQETYARAAGWDEKLAWVEDNIIYVFDMANAEYTLNINSWHTDEIMYILMAENILLVCSRDNTASLYILEDNSERIYTVIADHADAVSHIALHGSGDFYVTSSFDNTVKVWNTNFTKEWSKEYNLVTTLKGHDGSVLQSVLGLDDEMIFSAGTDGKVILWDFYYPRSKLKAHIDSLDVDIRPLNEEDY
ncbi:MAG: hypothetical protein DHS20C18_17190 [Saprospiraceae bacterium]|nr:MAG: hypothetical protein DHS20C18_17190 [Saprospiraceae bacterium]